MIVLEAHTETFSHMRDVLVHRVTRVTALELGRVRFQKAPRGTKPHQGAPGAYGALLLGFSQPRMSEQLFC